MTPKSVETKDRPLVYLIVFLVGIFLLALPVGPGPVLLDFFFDLGRFISEHGGTIIVLAIGFVIWRSWNT